MIVELYEGEKLILKADFPCLPRVGEGLSKDSGGYYTYYDVVEVWYRQVRPTGPFKACIGVVLKD